MRTVSVEARRIDEPDDAAVIARSMRDPDRFAAIYELYFVEIYQYIAGRLGRDVADDLAAETFLVAFRKRDRVDPARGQGGPGRPRGGARAAVAVRDRDHSGGAAPAAGDPQVPGPGARRRANARVGRG